MVTGHWSLVPGYCFPPPGPWPLAPGPCLLAPGPCLLAPGPWPLAPGSWPLAPGRSAGMYFSQGWRASKHADFLRCGARLRGERRATTAT